MLDQHIYHNPHHDKQLAEALELVNQMASTVYQNFDDADWIASPEYALCHQKYRQCSEVFYSKLSFEPLPYEEIQLIINGFRNCFDLVFKVSSFYFM